MRNQESRISVNASAKAIRRSEEKRIKRLLALCVATVFIIFAACAVFGNFMSSAHNSRSDSPDTFKYYTSIEIQPGDTLWDIAEAYITEDYESVTEYVKALKQMNSLDTDDIQAGQSLMVAYNDTEFVAAQNQ